MPVAMPESVREAWGEQVVRDFTAWLDEVLQERGMPRDQWRQILSRLDALEQGVGHLQEQMGHMQEQIGYVREQVAHTQEQMGRMQEQMNHVEKQVIRTQEQLQHVQEQVVHIQKQVEQLHPRFDYVHERFDTLNERLISQTRWTVGVLALFGTIFAILVAVAQFSP